MCYIARKSCGCVVVWLLDIPADKKNTAREVAKCIRDGYTVERMTVGAARAGGFGCKCKVTP